MNNRIERTTAIETAKVVIEIWKNKDKDPQNVYRVADKVGKIVTEYRNLRRRKTGISDRKKTHYLNSIRGEFNISKDVSKRNVGAPVEIQEVAADDQIAGPSSLNVDVNMTLATPSNVQTVYPMVKGYQLRENRAPNNNPLGIEDDDEENITDKHAPSKDLCSLYERAGISSRLASFIYLAHAKEFGINPANVICSNATMNRYRHRYQREGAEAIFERVERNEQYTLHWDGKTYVKRGQKDKRMAIVVTKNNFTQTLDVVKVETGFATENSNVIWNLILEWGLQDCINSFSFDTENTNSGRKRGICKNLEQKFGRKMLQLACRRHVSELILKAAFNSTVELGLYSTSPNIPLFEKFCAQFHSPSFNRSSYVGVEGDNFFDGLISSAEKINLTDFCKKQLIGHSQSTRSDYIELLKLVITLVSPEDRHLYNIHAPGSYSRARFMSRIIYCIKIYMFRKQLQIKKKGMDDIRRFLVFILKVYLEHWFMANQAVSAPRNDLRLLKKLNELLEIIPLTAQATIAKMKKHLWYVSEVLIALAFFDPDVPNEIKRRMVGNLERDLPFQRNQNRFELEEVNIAELQLHDFVSTQTRTFFEMTKIEDDFLALDPSDWQNHIGFNNGRETISNLAVVNDAAERAIALFQNVEQRATTDVRKTRILQVVEDHRNRHSSMRKGDIIAELYRN